MPSFVSRKLCADLPRELQEAVAYVAASKPDMETQREVRDILETRPAGTLPEREVQYLLGRLVRTVPVPKTRTPVPPLSVTVLSAPTATDEAPEAPLALVQAAWARDADVVVGPEWLFCPKQKLLSRTELEALLATLRELTVGSDRLLVPGTLAWQDEEGGYHNTAVALSGGEILLRYDKRNDGDDVELAARYGAHFKPGTEPGLFQWRGLQVGLEICRDHGDSRLTWDLRRAGSPPLDLQLVVSAGVWLKQPVVGVGGVAILAQGTSQHGAEVLRRDRLGRMAEPKSATREELDGARLHTFRV